MQKENVKEAINQARESSKERKFKQSFDLVISLKDIDLKKTEQQVDFFATIPHAPKKKKICAFVDNQSRELASKSCDFVVTEDEFQEYGKDKKKAKKIAREYDFFIAQANLMAKVAAAFGRALGPKGKMPNPKAGAVFPPKAALDPIYSKLQKTVRISAKTAPMIQLLVGKEDTNEDEIISNVLSLYEQVVNHLPQEENNIKAVYLKLT